MSGVKIKAIRSEYESIDLMLREVQEQFGHIRSGIIIAFIEGGDMHTCYYATSQELAMASVRLAELASRNDYQDFKR